MRDAKYESKFQDDVLRAYAMLFSHVPSIMQMMNLSILTPKDLKAHCTTPNSRTEPILNKTTNIDTLFLVA